MMRLVSTATKPDSIAAGLERMRAKPTVLAAMGHVAARAATAWIDVPEGLSPAWSLGSDFSGRLTLSGSPAAVSLTDLGCALEPGRAYRLTIEGAEPLAFHTDYDVDDPDAHYALAIGSCHQPFTLDGSPDPQALRTLRALDDVTLPIRRTLLLGDQMYSDQPEPLSLFDEEVVRVLSDGAFAQLADVPEATIEAWFADRYRAFWSLPSFQKMLQRAPTYMVWDDHEIWDNYGTGQADQTPANQRIFAAAQRAYARFARLGRPREASVPDYTFRFGRMAALVVDVRTHRGYDDGRLRVFSDDQKATLPRQLASLADAAVLIVGVSVPFLNFPTGPIDWLGRVLKDGNNVQDRWAFGDARPERRWFLETLAAHADAHPHQKIVIVGGDIHFGMASQLHRGGRGAPIYQLVSSALSNGESRLVQGVVSLSLRSTRSVEPSVFTSMERLPGEGAPNDQNPYLGRNVGLVEIQHRGADTGVRLSLMSGDTDGQPAFPFRSAYL